MSFDYTRYKPMDEHGSRWANPQRVQVAGPWNRRGCDYDFRGCSFSWMKELVRRRDEMTCQSCGVETILSGWEGRPDMKRAEVQHIIPVTVLLARLNEFRAQVTPMISPFDRASAEGQYLGLCGHNLVLLCRRCHLRTFKRGYAGVPAVPGSGVGLEEFG